MEYTVIVDYFRRCVYVRDVSSTTKKKNPSVLLFQQISYADMLTKVDPLRNELKSLEIEAQASRIKVTRRTLKIIGRKEKLQYFSCYLRTTSLPVT